MRRLWQTRRADPQGGRIDETDAAARSHASPQIANQRGKRLRDPFDETVVTQKLRELAAQVLANVLEVKVLERAVVGAVKQDQDRHDLAQVHPALAMTAMSYAVRQQMPFPSLFERDGELVQIVEQCDDVHWRPPCRTRTLSS